MFLHSKEALLQLSERVLHFAKQMGADATAVHLSESLGQSVSVRMREIEQIEYEQQQSLAVTVYLGQRKAHASTADFSENALRQTIQAALNIAQHAAEDPYSGLADAALLAKKFGDLDQFHPWDLSTEQAKEMALQCENAALDCDARIVNSEGASVNNSQYQHVYANSQHFAAHRQGTRHGISCSVLGQDKAGMQRNYWYDYACAAEDLDNVEKIGKEAAKRTIAKLNQGKLKTGSYPILFDNTISGSLIGHLIQALSGSALYRKNSFLCDSLGKKILADCVHLREEPHIPRAFGSTYYDSEGVATHARDIVKQGEINGYFLSSYSARKLGMQTTGNAGGTHNLILSPTTTRSDLLKGIKEGLLITELMGQGVNILTGDYSRGASGFWVENGEIAYPVSEITIASTLPEMLAGIVGIGDDALKRNTHKIGSILLEKMTVASAY